VSLYGRIFAANYERVLAASERAGLSALRRRLLEHAHGRVVELGSGPAMNLPHYPPTLKELVLTEPEEPMVRRLRKRVAADRPEARVVRAGAEALPFDDDSFDCAVVGFVLCTVPDPQRAVDEVIRVLRPGGKFLFLEHVRSSEERLARWQDRLHGVWLRFAHGCHCNRRTLELLHASDLEVGEVEQGRLPRNFPVVSPYVMGVATAPR
jgi:ubiquinone/menaquinone biosynthesis C-methylase UbiE